MIIRISLNQSLSGDIYLPVNSNNKTIIFLGGMPSYFYKNSISENLSQVGFTVIQPFYYGSWVSNGDFSAKNCIQTLTDTIQAINNNTIINSYNNQLLNLDSKEIYLMGTSFGSTLVQIYKDSEYKLEKRICLAGIPVFEQKYNQQIHFNHLEFIDFIKRGFKNLYRSDSWQEWEKELSGNGEFFHDLNLNPDYLFLQAKDDNMANYSLISSYAQEKQIKANIVEINGKHSLESFDTLQITKNIIEFTS